ncbi:MAG: Na+/H+ antiporter subunit E [Acidobacteriota bacterium]
MTSRIAFYIVALVVWCVLTWPTDVQNLVAGLIVCAVATWIAGHIFVGRAHLLVDPRRYLVFLFQYLPLFLWEVFKANFDVAYRVLHPLRPIRPGIVEVKTTLVSDIGLTFLANSVTLTPGTMTVDVDRERGRLYVHWIDVKATESEEATRRVVGRFEPILRKVFEEEGVQP